MAKLDCPPSRSPGEALLPLAARDQARTSRPRQGCVHELFVEQAARAPHAVAVESGEEQITYAQLDTRSDRIAVCLQRMGVGRNTPVGVFLERSPELPAVLLAVLKAGGAYVPLDPHYPAERLSFMIADSRMPVIVAHERDRRRLVSAGIASSGLLQNDAAPQVLWLGQEVFCDAPGASLPSSASSEDLAYVIYTSGSTGTPKGVAIPHRGVVRLVKNTDYMSFGPRETFLQLASISFDASTLEFWGALLNGGRLVVAPPGPVALAEIGLLIQRHHVTTLWLTAGLFHLMIDERPGDLRGLRQLLVGGDVLSVPHVRRALRELPDCRLINGYGPTESTTFACCHTILPDEPLDGGVPLGRPIAHTSIHVLDAHLRPVPTGETGEICIGGAGLARGYWLQPELTAQRFIEREDGERIYKTGDLGRWRADGVLEFGGRADEQVKIRGYRVEPGEIEAVLAQHVAVRGAVVTASALANNSADKRLTAFFVPSAQPPPPPAELRAFLGGKLPAYMVPSDFVSVEAFPLTANGKVDRRALQGFACRRDLAAAAAPRTELEETIAAIWREVLGTEHLGIHDNFFDAGGTSLRLVEVHSRLARTLRRPLRVTALLQHPTIAALAKHLRGSSTSDKPRLGPSRNQLPSQAKNHQPPLP